MLSLPPMPLLQHFGAWVAQVTDRLDPFFYRRHVPAYAATGVLEVQESLAEGLKRSQEDLAAIASELPAGFSAELKDVELSEVLKEVRVREVIEPDRRYKLLGVKWWGEGAFIREERYGREVKGSGLARVQKGWIIYNRLFAYRGAFAVLAGGA
jgi:hypothetical protein